MNNKGRIFVLDDDGLIGTMLSRALTVAGHDVRVETDAGGVVGKIRSWRPDIVLLDISLQGHSALDILREVLDQRIDTGVVATLFLPLAKVAP